MRIASPLEVTGGIVNRLSRAQQACVRRTLWEKSARMTVANGTAAVLGADGEMSTQ